MSMIVNVLQDEQTSTEVEPSRKKQKTSGALGLNWHGKYLPAMEEFSSTRGSFIIKNDNTNFACHPSRGDFIEEWCARQDNDTLPIYEVIVDGPARLHFDVEGIYPGPPPTHDEMSAWLGLVITIVKESLIDIGVDEKDRERFVIGSDCRPSTDGYKRSFHLTWCNVFFSNNHTEMKSFIDVHICPKIKAKCALQWIAQYKKGPMVKFAVDFGIYTRNRPFRVIYAKKHGKTCLVPWDRVEWKELIFDSDDKKEEWFESTLVSGADTEYATVIAPRAVLPTVTFKSSVEQTEIDTEGVLDCQSVNSDQLCSRFN